MIYKIFTGLIAELMWHHIENYGILPVEQRGCVPGSLSCREQLLIGHMILHNARTRQRNLSMAYIDFRKAYDSVSHGWIFAMLEIFKFHKNIVNTLRRCMAQWQTRMHVTSKDQSVTTEPIIIARGIFQGDSLSPLLFCLALTPISRELERMNCGY